MLSAVVLTKNEEKTIERCLKSLMFCDEIIVVDDGSTDGTVEHVYKVNKCRDRSRPVPTKVFQRKLARDFAGQRNFGMSKTSNEWVLFVDADEEVTRELQREIEVTLRQAQGDNSRVMVSLTNHDKDAYYVRRRDFFWGKELKYGEVRQIRLIGLIRLIRKDSGKWLGNVHEEFKVKSQKSKVKSLNSFLNHYPHQTLKEFIKDINDYSSIRAEELYNQGKNVNVIEIMFVPAIKFIYNYLINLGFLDGAPGFAYAFLMSFHSFLVRAKLYMLKSSMPFFSPSSPRHKPTAGPQEIGEKKVSSLL